MFSRVLSDGKTDAGKITHQIDISYYGNYLRKWNANKWQIRFVVVREGSTGFAIHLGHLAYIINDIKYQVLRFDQVFS